MARNRIRVDAAAERRVPPDHVTWTLSSSSLTNRRRAAQATGPLPRA